MDNRCIACGDLIPEGRMVCPRCERSAEDRLAKPKHPCQICIHYEACGESTRTMPCAGRMTRRERGK
jgi:hypothetical protein